MTLGLLRDRGYENVRVFASARSAGKDLGGWTVEEATPEALSRGDVDIFLFSVGTSASRELVPLAVKGGAVAVDKSSAYRLEPGIPLVVPEVNAGRAFEHNGIVANPNCCTIPLTCVLKPLHDAAGLARVRVATYQSVSGAGAQSMERLRNEAPAEHDLRMDWDFDGEEFDEESKLRAETQKIMELPDLPIQATCVRVPVLVGHAEAVWIETEDDLTPGAGERPAGRGAFSAPRGVPDTGQGRRHRRCARRTHSARPDGRARIGALPRERQPPQGRGAERDPDRRARSAPRARSRVAEQLRVGPVAALARRRRRRNTLGHTERILHHTDHLLARPLGDRLQPAELEP